MLITNTKKKGLLLGLCALGVVIVLTLYNNNKLITLDQRTDLTQTTGVEYGLPTRQPTAPQPSPPMTQTPQKAMSPSAAEFVSIMGNPADMAQVKNWFEARGYGFWGADNNEYKTYDEETLQKLSASGDIRALQELGDLYLGKYGYDKAKEIYINAAVYGSTNALESIGTTIKYHSFIGATPEEQKAASIEVLAWYSAAALRGDMWPSVTGGRMFISNNNIAMNDELMGKVQHRAEEIYADLVQKRKSLGLPDFDNSYPASVGNYFNKLATP